MLFWVVVGRTVVSVVDTGSERGFRSLSLLVDNQILDIKTEGSMTINADVRGTWERHGNAVRGCTCCLIGVDNDLRSAPRVMKFGFGF